MYDFFNHRLAKECFAEVDYWLKSGYYIQKKYPKHEKHFNFIHENKQKLKGFYRHFYDVELRWLENKVNEIVYFIDFPEDSNTRINRGKIGIFNNTYLDGEYVIIGLFLKYLNSVEDILSISKVQYHLQNDNEFKDDFYNLFAKISNKQILNSDTIKVNKIIEKALKKFGEMRWLYFYDEDNFKIMPAFARLTQDLYADEINNFPQLLEKIKNEQTTN